MYLKRECSRMQTYKNWRLETDADKILWVYFDKQNSSVNTLGHETMSELDAILDDLASDRDHKGVIFASAKKSGFIAGADISLFTKFKDADEAYNMLKLGQHIFDKIETLHIPTVAMIDGFCLGGGMELALGCHYR